MPLNNPGLKLNNSIRSIIDELFETNFYRQKMTKNNFVANRHGFYSLNQLFLYCIMIIDLRMRVVS